MVPERVTLTIRSSAGEDAPLTVDDATRQILDFFEMLSASGGPEGTRVSWRLVDISMKSPLKLTAEPFSDDPGIPVQAVARREKRALAESFREMTTVGRVPDWMDRPVRRRAQSFFARHTRSIGRTDVLLDESAPPIIIIPQNAAIAETALAKEPADPPPARNLTRTEIGSIDGQVTDTTTYYGHPAVRIRERVTEADVVCVLSASLAERVGVQHNWRDVWQGRRVLVSGEISYRADGAIARIQATDISTIDTRPLEYSDIVDPNFTGGLTPGVMGGGGWLIRRSVSVGTLAPGSAISRASRIKLCH
jgi:hypothetical protein